MPVPAAREIVADLATWQVVVPTAEDVLAAIDGTLRWHPVLAGRTQLSTQRYVCVVKGGSDGPVKYIHQPRSALKVQG